jgi:hypothetical protein
MRELDSSWLASCNVTGSGRGGLIPARQRFWACGRPRRARELDLSDEREYMVGDEAPMGGGRGAGR